MVNDSLNSKIWDTNGQIYPDIQERLLQIALNFFNELEIDAPLKDIILTGSLANYNYHDQSDFDLHIIIDIKEILGDMDFVKQSLNALRFKWNTTFDIHIKGHEVEIYVQDVNEPHVANGQYSILHDKWLVKPKKQKYKVDEVAVQNKYHVIAGLITEYERQCNSGDNNPRQMHLIGKGIISRIKKMRQMSLKEEGEQGTGNVVFKKLRNLGDIKRLIDNINRQYELIFSDRFLNFFKKEASKRSTTKQTKNNTQSLILKITQGGFNRVPLSNKAVEEILSIYKIKDVGNGKPLGKTGVAIKQHPTTGKYALIKIKK